MAGAPVRLCRAALGRLPAAVSAPAYARADLSPGIVHLGAGNFLRAHLAHYLHRLFQRGRARDWAVLAASTRPADAALRAALLRQDLLYTLVTRPAARPPAAAVVAALLDYLPPADAPALLAALARPPVRLVSLTLTEGGYLLDRAGRFDPAHPALALDAAAAAAGRPPVSAFGLLAAALRARRDAGVPPFAVVSCDNLPRNGAAARAAVVGAARRLDPPLAAWIHAHVPFPSSMVDRITPATGPPERAAVRSDWGLADDAPVFCEHFAQWVLEDCFPAGRPPLEDVGVQFVPDVHPFETMKIRILNGGHAALAYPAALLGVHFVHDALRDDLLLRFVRKVELDEIVPAVPPVPGVRLGDYLAEVLDRFGNPNVRDTVRRLCLDGSNRQPKFIVPTVRDRLALGAPVRGLALVSALWCRYCFGTTEDGVVIEPNDPNWDELVPLARAAKEDPAVWLRQDKVYGELSSNAGFSRPFAEWLDAIWKNGTRAALRTYLEGD